MVNPKFSFSKVIGIILRTPLYMGTYPRECPRFSLIKSIGYLRESWRMRTLQIKDREKG